MNNLYIDKFEKWRLSILHQIYTANPVGIGRKLCQYIYIPVCIVYRFLTFDICLNFYDKFDEKKCV